MRILILLLLPLTIFAQPRGFINSVRNIVSVTTVSGNNFVSEYKPLNMFAFSHSVINNPVDGYLYFAALSKGGSPHNRSHYVFKYDKATNTLVSSFEVPRTAGITSSYEVHPTPVIMVDASGHVYLIVERSGNSTGWSDNHETDVLIYKTTTPGDVSTIVLWQTVTGKYSYPRLWIDGANYYMIARGKRTAPADATYITLEKSTNTGSSWSEITVHRETGAYLPYSTKIESDDGWLWMVYHPRSNTNATITEIGVIKSQDGVTWQNAQGTWSKNVSVSGYITTAELQANCRVVHVGNEATTCAWYEGAKVEGGVVKILMSMNTVVSGIVDGNVGTQPESLRLYTLSAGSWVYEDVSAILPSPALTSILAYGNYISYARTATTEYIIIIDRANQLKTVVREFSSFDGFDTYTSRVLMTGTMNLYMGSSAANFGSGKFLVVYNTIGSYNNYANYSDLKVIDLN